MAKEKREITVHCEFTDGGKAVQEILHELFLAFVRRKIRENAFFDR